ncbi:glycosyltransferase [Pedobacter frigiditerrae]|uniref:glycosyltransferase n=1 Tax=Pedobacter frigiditerrae TaxID=2530452 RepID=UPI00292DA2B2|nr:glycosyltransferase [Pedobacter frigiditerrae]
MYHKVDLYAPTEWWVDVNSFYKQMHSLRNKKVVDLATYDPTNPDHVVITFDGVYKNVLIYATPILFHFNYPFELFITSEYIGKRNDFDKSEPSCDFASLEDLKEMEKFGGIIQWHTKTHLDLLKVEDSRIIEDELAIPEELRIFNNKSFNYFAYPYGNFNNAVKKISMSLFNGAVSCIQGSDDDFFELNRLTVTNDTNFQENKISCIIPCYNYGQFLPDALDSVLKQSILPYEIIIADDASSDNTEEISKYYVQKNPHLIKYVKNADNLGIINNFNKAIALTSGDYVVLLGADNRFQTNYFEECSNILNCDAKISVAYSDFKLFGPGAEKLYNNFYEGYKGPVRQDFYEINFPETEDIDVLGELKNRNFIHGSSMFRKSSFLKVGGYKSSQEIPEDYNLFYRMVKIGFGVRKAKNTYLQYRQHSDAQANHLFGLQITVNLYIKRNKELEDELRLLKKYGIVKGISFLHQTKVNILKSANYLKENGLQNTFNKIFRNK